MTHPRPFHRQTAALLMTSALMTATANAAGLMTPAQGNLGALEIRSHHVNVIIEDGYAITTVDQVFANPHDHTLEAIYSFPVPEKAAVGEFTYWIDGKPVTGEVMEKQAARHLYEQEKAQGRQTAIAEQDAYKTFDTSVYPVLPNDEVQIRMVYLQPVHTDLGIGRYVYPLEEGGVDQEKLAFWQYNDKVEEAFSFNLQMRSSYPVDNFRLPAHPQAAIHSTSPREWQVAFGNQPARGAAEKGAATVQTGPAHQLNEDIVVYWRHEQGLPGSVDMVAYKPEGAKRGTFMLTVTPGDDLGDLSGGRDWVFVLDYSGSMEGKYHSLVEGIREGLGKLSPNDRFRIVLFNDGAREITRGYVPVTREKVDHYMHKLESIRPDGGTNLYAGLKQGYRSLDADRPSAVMLVTDGVANVGVTEKKAFLQLLEQHDVRLHAFVMGNSANRPLLEGMTRVSNGFSVNISNNDDIAGLLLQTASKLQHESYRDIDVAISGVKVKALTPERVGTLYQGQQLTLFGHYWGDGPAEVTISGRVSDKDKVYRSDLVFPATRERNPELERLWAYASIEHLQSRIDYLGEDADSKKALVDIALEYGLVTDYTSLVVVREEVFEQLGMDRNNQARVAAEKAARQSRANQSVQNHRQDTANPAFSQPRAYPSQGGGNIGALGLLLLLPLLLIRRRAKA